jgi:exosortase
MTDRTASPVRLSPAAVVAGAALGALTLWAFWPVLVEMAYKWETSPEYSHGYLVPLFSLFLLWKRRDRLAGLKRLSPSWWGLLPIATACGLRYLATRNYDYLDGLALLLTVTGFFLLVGGPRVLAWAWPAAAFLLFMVPLPYSIEHRLAGPLQGLATYCSTYIMQTIGLPAIAEGNTILLGSGKIEVEYACSGLSMLMIFFALATAMAILIRRPLLDRVVILASAAPIALIANVARITATGLSQEWFGVELTKRIFHDWAGWMMMPFALALLGLELGVLSLILRESSGDDGRDHEAKVPAPFDFTFGQPAAPKSSRSVREGPAAAPPPGPRGVPPTGPSPVSALGS